MSATSTIGKVMMMTICRAQSKGKKRQKKKAQEVCLHYNFSGSYKILYSVMSEQTL